MSALIFVVVRVKDLYVNDQNKVSVLNWRLPLNAVKCLFKPRDGNKRKIVLFMLLVALGDRTVLAGNYIIIRSTNVYAFIYGVQHNLHHP